MPRECLVCGRPLLRKEHHLCLWCLSDLPQTWFWSLPRNRMSDSFNALVQRDLVASSSATPFDAVALGAGSTSTSPFAVPSVPGSTTPSFGHAECKKCSIIAPAMPFGHPECKKCLLSAPAVPSSHAMPPKGTCGVENAQLLLPSCLLGTRGAENASILHPSGPSVQARGSGGFEFEPYSYAAALFFYDTHARYTRITQALKYNGNIAAGRFFGNMLGERLAGSPMFADVDLVVPVPLHPLRRWRRGYNQAEVIARAVATRLGAPCDPSVLVRRQRTKTQTRLSVEEKAANVRTAFAVPDSSRLEGFHHILLIDDVYTTGATLNACRRTLREALRPVLRPTPRAPHPTIPQTTPDLCATPSPNSTGATDAAPFTRISIATLGFVGSA